MSGGGVVSMEPQIGIRGKVCSWMIGHRCRHRVSMEPQIGIRGRTARKSTPTESTMRFNGAPDRNPGKGVGQLFV